MRDFGIIVEIDRTERRADDGKPDKAYRCRKQNTVTRIKTKQKTEERITEWQEHLRELNIRKKQLEDAEIIKSIRSMKLNSRELLVVLDKIQNGTAVFPYLTEETTVPDTKKEEDWKDIAEERKLPGHRAEEKEDEHRENEN